MSGVFFQDGCTHYATNDGTAKWDAFVGAMISSTTPRYPGTKYIQLGPATWATKNFSSLATLYAGQAFYLASGNVQIITLYLAGSEQCNIYIYVDGSIAIRRSTTVLEVSAAGIVPFSAWFHLESAITVDNSGSWDIYLNGIRVLNNSGDTQLQASPETTGYRIYGVCNFTDVYLADDSLKGDSGIDTLLPAADGAAHTDFTAQGDTNKHDCIDDPGDIDGDTTYIHESTVNNAYTCTLDDLSTKAGSTIHSVAINSCCRKDDAGTRKFKPLMYINGSDYYGTEVSLNDSYKVHQECFSVNPDDSAAWEEADIDGSEWGSELTA